MSPERLDALVAFFETLRPETLDNFPMHYADNAYFKDPFNEVRGVSAIRRIFDHMFSAIVDPRFVVEARILGAETGGATAASAVLVWTLFYRSGRVEQAIRGATHLKFDADGKVAWHRDYWDAAEELYAKLPLLGWLMRRLQRALRAS